jgi:hydroxyacylglutathione hydrolase
MPAEIRVFRCLSDNIGALVHDPATGACAAIDAPEEAPILRPWRRPAGGSATSW